MDSFLTAHSHFVTNEITGEKAASSPSKQKNKKVINRAKSRSPKRKDEFELGQDSDASDVDYCGPLQATEITVDFSELKVHK